jgi:phosphohistidine phosphatase
VDLILIRHAEAGSRDNARWPNDDDRPITDEGVQKQRQIAKAMKKMGISFDFLVTSPRLRARQTADVVANVYRWKEPPLEADQLGKTYSPASLVKFLAKFPPSATVALVGHEPDLSNFAAHMITPSGEAGILLKKSGVIGLTFNGPAEAGRAQLSFLLKPGHARRLA